MEALLPAKLRFPLNEDARVSPMIVLRSAIFSYSAPRADAPKPSSAKRRVAVERVDLIAALLESRQRMDHAVLASYGDWYIVQTTGWQATQRDADVWFEILDLAVSKQAAPSVYVSFEEAALLRKLGRDTSSVERKRLRASLRVLTGNTYLIDYPGRKNPDAQLHLIEATAGIDEDMAVDLAGGRALSRRHTVKVGAEIVELFSLGGYSKMKSSIRAQFGKTPFAKWMYGAVANWSPEYPLPVESLKAWSCETGRHSDFIKAIASSAKLIKEATGWHTLELTADKTSLMVYHTAADAEAAAKKSKGRRKPAKASTMHGQQPGQKSANENPEARAWLRELSRHDLTQLLHAMGAPLLTSDTLERMHAKAAALFDNGLSIDDAKAALATAYADDDI